jgi:hypothetical protein
MTVAEFRKRIVGRHIVGYEANAFRDGRRRGNWSKSEPFEPPPEGGAITYDPVFILDDGSRIKFHVHETEGSEYGIDPILEKP